MTFDTLHRGLSETEAYLERRRKGEKHERDNTPTPASNFSDRVRLLRNRLKLSQSQFAERYGLPLRTIQNWEQGRRTRPDASGSLLIGLIERDPDGMANLVGGLSE